MVDENIAPMLLLGSEIYELTGTFPGESKLCEKIGYFVKSEIRDKIRQVQKKQPIEVQNEPLLATANISWC